MTRPTSLAAHMVQAVPSAVPPSFNGDTSLYGANLFMMTAVVFLAFMMAGRQAKRIWAQRAYDHPLHPVTLYRLVTVVAALGFMLMCGGEALLLWGWNPADPAATARVVMAKRWIDPVAILCGCVWMAVALLGEPGMEHQLRKSPLPVDMWSRWPVLARAAAVVVLSLVMALAAVIFR